MSLQYAILGILNYGPMTGYDIKKVFDSSLNYFWTAQTSQIYRDLGTLNDKGYVTFHIVNQEAKPDKKVFQLTALGRSKFLSWLEIYPKQSVQREEMLIHLFFSGALNIEIVMREMQAYLQTQRGLLEALKTINPEKEAQQLEDGYDRERFFWNMCIQRGKYAYEANIRWAEDVLNQLENLK